MGSNPCNPTALITELASLGRAFIILLYYVNDEDEDDVNDEDANVSLSPYPSAVPTSFPRQI